MSNKYTMRINLNVLNHLGINLYSSTPAVLSEVIANAWDAGASNVWIETENNTIAISDDGQGMNLSDINKRFLLVGYSKREDSDAFVPSDRQIMGRKGIGKLSLFSIANIIDVYSVKEGEKNGFQLNVNKIREIIKSGNNTPYHPEQKNPEEIRKDTDFEHGTRIVISDFKRSINRVESYLKRRIARRFSVIGEQFKFSVFVNKKPITVEDMDYFKKLEYIRLYNKTESILNRCSESIIHENKDGKVYVSGKAYQVGGWLGFVKHSGDLNDETTGENINKILILVRGKLAQENMLDEFREGGLYTKFLIGEIHADFLDLDDEEDIATSSRQSINENDERYIALKDFVQEELKNMGQERARYKTENAVKDAAEILPPVKEWIESYKGDNRKKARELIGKINQTSLNPEQKKDHFKHGIIAFERMNLKGSLDALVRVNADNIGEVIRLFSDYDDIEDAMYYEITHGRLTVIDKLQENIDNDAKEKVLQEYLFNHLWLLDPSWDRATEVPEMEKGITLKLNGMKEGETDEIKRGRIDIQYRKTSGKHLIIELKRTSVHPRHTEIIDQLDKYGTALENELKTRSIPISYEKIVIVGGKLQGWNIPNKEEKDRNTLKAENIRLLTYQELIHNAQLMYKEYLDKKAGKSKIFKILNRISES